MSSVRHRSTAELPPSPLDFAYLLAVPDATVLGAVVLHEVPEPFALHALQALRLVFAWAAGPQVSGAVFDFTDLRGWEVEVLRTTGIDEALWAPVAVIAGELAEPAELDRERLCNACLAVTEWALGAQAHGTALLYAEAAAVVWPNNARIAWLTGKLYRERQQFGRAELWLRRARRVAVWTGDWELQAQAINSLGNLKVRLGDLPGGRELLLSAARLAKRKRLRERLGKAQHDLFVVSTYIGRFTEAEAHAKQAFIAYGRGDPKLIDLAFDVSHFWTRQGQFSRALRVLTSLLGRFPDADRQVRVAASTARAAGAVGQVAAFHDAWQESWTLINEGSVDHLRAVAALELGLGAMSLNLSEHAGYALATARDAAQELREGDTLARAEAALVNLAPHEAADQDRMRRSTRLHPDDLAIQLADSIDAQPSIVSGS